jgi:hypothetical protein
MEIVGEADMDHIQLLGLDHLQIVAIGALAPEEGSLLLGSLLNEVATGDNRGVLLGRCGDSVEGRDAAATDDANLQVCHGTFLDLLVLSECVQMVVSGKKTGGL